MNVNFCIMVVIIKNDENSNDGIFTADIKQFNHINSYIQKQVSFI